MTAATFRTRASVLAAALGIVLAGATSATAATSRPAEESSVPRTIYNVGCWTTFVPNAPGGAPMTHYYANCDNHAVTVCPAVDFNGTRTVYYGSAVRLGAYDGVADDTDTAVWNYASTIPNGQYTTVFC
ncbi:hypothetical protein AB0A70_30345 [Streptomyces morookaense]|uniref:hypothetical protein n=1 Tax=Streptomyces morookaense TaxID=1970 RepID=UPI0033E176DA